MGQKLFWATTACSIALTCATDASLAAEVDSNRVLEKLAALEARVAGLEKENHDYRRRLAHVQAQAGALTRTKPKSSGANLLLVQALAADETPVAPASNPAPVRMPTKAPAAHPVGNWTGFYIGGSVGYGWGSYGAANATGTLVTTNGGSAPYGFNAVSGNGNGVTGGIQAGYNWQIERTVLGIEADWHYLDSKASTANSAIAVPAFIGGNFSGTTSVSTEWYATFRGRLGYALGPALLYATGGLALADTKLSTNATGSIATGAVLPIPLGPLGSMNASESPVLVGYAVGGGVEYALGAGWSAKGEYLHMGFGANGYNSTGSLQSPAGLTGVIATHVDIKPSFDIARAGVNYHF